MRNDGARATGLFNVLFHLSQDGTFGGSDDVALGGGKVFASLAANTTSGSVSTSVTVPAGTPRGTYRLCAMVDLNGFIPEANISNNSTCAAGTLAVDGPDLVVGAIEPGASTASAGGTLAATYTVRNDGPAGSIPSMLAFRLSPNGVAGDGDDLAIATTATIWNLAGHASADGTTTLTLPATTPPGVYHLCAIANAGYYPVPETDMSNNGLCSTGTITLAPPDLRVTAVSTSTVLAAPGASFSLSNTVANQGGSQAGAFAVEIHLSTDEVYGGGDDIALPPGRSIASLGGGASSAETTSLTVPSSVPLGAYHVCAMADPAAAVAESDRSNNSACTTAVVWIGEVDLVADSAEPAAATATGGGTLDVTRTVRNPGNLDSPAFSLAYRLSPNAVTGDADDVVITLPETIAGLAAGASSSRTQTLEVPPTIAAGSYHVCIKADSGDNLAETNETNNTCCSAAVVTVAPPELTLTVSTGATSARLGGTFSVTTQVANGGGLLAGASLVAFHLSADALYGGVDDVALTATRSVAALGGGAQSSGATTLTVPANTPPGAWYVCAIADSAGAVAESDETNNSACTSGIITVGVPDLTVLSVTPKSASAQERMVLQVDYAIKNEGPASGGYFLVSVALSTNQVQGDSDDLAGSTTGISDIAAGATATGTAYSLLPEGIPVGSYYVCVKADSTDLVVEGDETNNALCSSTQVTVGPPDLLMLTASTMASSVARGATLTVGSVVQNAGGVAAGPFKVRFYLTANSTVGDGDDIALAPDRTLTGLLPGSSFAETDVTIPAGLAPGTYRLAAVADPDAEVAESNESNNSLPGYTITVN